MVIFPQGILIFSTEGGITARKAPISKYTLHRMDIQKHTPPNWDLQLRGVPFFLSYPPFYVQNVEGEVYGRAFFLLDECGN